MVKRNGQKWFRHGSWWRWLRNNRKYREVLHMILTEYDEKKHFRTLFREGKEEGREELLREQVKKKLDKGKTIAEIAEDLEEEISVIERMMP